MIKQPFSGDKKEGVSFLHHAEVTLKEKLVPCVPCGIETYHLTFTTIIWSILVILFSWLACYNRNWMWGTSLCIVAQYVTDLLDGEIGRLRDTGLIKWGFYMDHLLDYVFLCSMLIGYSLLMPDNLKYLMFFVMAVFGAFMVNSFLQFAATNAFRIAYWGIGPTEIRLGFIIVNTLIIYVNQSVWIRELPIVLTIVLTVATFGLFFTACMTQRLLWKIDMDIKAQQSGHAVNPLDDVQGLITRHFLVSFIIASLAFLILIMQIGRPFHMRIACGVFAASWLPLLAALSHKQWIHIKNIPIIRRLGPLVLAGILLGLSAWVALTLTPPTADITQYSQSQMQEYVDGDARRVLEIHETIQSALTPASLSGAFLVHQNELTEITNHYQGYHLIDFHTHPQLHTQAFLVSFSALALQQNTVFTWTLSHPTEASRQTLNQSDPNRHIEANTFDRLLRSLVLPKTLLKISAGSTYMKILKDHIHSTQNESPLSRDLAQIALRHSEAYYQKLEAHPEIVIDASKTIHLF
jgi:hypothetical protein